MNIVCRDKKYVSGEVCLNKWSVEDGPMPANPQKCGDVAVAGIGLTRTGQPVHPSDPGAVADMFLCERHARMYEKRLQDGAHGGEFIPKLGGTANS